MLYHYHNVFGLLGQLISTLNDVQFPKHDKRYLLNTENNISLTWEPTIPETRKKASASLPGATDYRTRLKLLISL